MIINEFAQEKRNTDLDRMIEEIVKGRIGKMTNETIEELEKVAKRLKHARAMYKNALGDIPELDTIIQAQVRELERITRWIKREVE